MSPSGRRSWSSRRRRSRCPIRSPRPGAGSTRFFHRRGQPHNGGVNSTFRCVSGDRQELTDPSGFAFGCLPAADLVGVEPTTIEAVQHSEHTAGPRNDPGFDDLVRSRHSSAPCRFAVRIRAVSRFTVRRTIFQARSVPSQKRPAPAFGFRRGTGDDLIALTPRFSAAFPSPRHERGMKKPPRPVAGASVVYCAARLERCLGDGRQSACEASATR